VLRRGLRAVTTAAPLRHRAGGAGSRTSSHPRTTTLPLGSQQNASPFCARRIRNLPAGADNRLVAGSSPPGPTTHSHANRDFPWFDEYPAVLRGRKAGLAVSAGKKDRFRGSSGPSSLASKNRFPGAWEGAARDSVRMRQRPVCSQEFREELGHDGHAIVDAHAIAGLPLESYVSGSQIGDGGKTVALRGKADQITSA
jgi:hypothetical protein